MSFILKGLYVITDKKLIDRLTFEKTVEKTLKGGAKIVQFREKNTPENELLEIGKNLLEITKKYNVPLIINDSPEIAKEVDADGVHLGENDPDILHARRILGENKIIGVSCYGEIKRGLGAVKKGADYLVFGTPYYTPTKPDRKPTPFETIIKARSLFRNIPIFAIGGINASNAKEVIKTGVDGIAVITSVFSSRDPEESSRELASFFN